MFLVWKVSKLWPLLRGAYKSSLSHKPRPSKAVKTQWRVGQKLAPFKSHPFSSYVIVITLLFHALNLVPLFFSNIFCVDLSFSVVSCPEQFNPVNGSMNCLHPLGSFSFRSTCGFSCDEGYELVPSNSTSLQCGASGSWNDSQPHCSGMTSEQNLHVAGTKCDQLKKQMYTYAEINSQILMTFVERYIKGHWRPSKTVTVVNS